MIKNRREEILKFHARYFPEETKSCRHENSNGHQSELKDEEVVKLAGRARNSAKLSKSQGEEVYANGSLRWNHAEWRALYTER